MPPAKASPVLDPVAFFTGATRGEGQIKVVFKSAVLLEVQSRGIPDGKGGIMLNQRISEGSKQSRFRHWAIRPVGPGRFGGMLTDATGPPTVTTQGNTARISYPMHSGMIVEQRLVLADDRRTIHNRMTIRKWGLPVARIDEVIRKQAGSPAKAGVQAAR
jgi:DNA-directed RNA polymerase subunit H (RpoH/RPB5)